MNEFSHNIEEIIGVLSDNDTGWCKYLTKTAWGDNEAKTDIRPMNLEAGKVGKGITLSDSETNMLVNLLICKGFGTIEILKEALNKREAILAEKGVDPVGCDILPTQG